VLFQSADKATGVCLEEKIHHDNAPARDELRVAEFLAKKSIAEMDHAPYSPDSAVCNFGSFQN
jgi:hypothetical protein